MTDRGAWMGLRERLRFLFRGIPPEPTYLVPPKYRGELWLSLHDGEPGRDGDYEVRVIGRRPVQFEPPAGPVAPLTTNTTTFRDVPRGVAFSHWALWRPWEPTTLRTGAFERREEFRYGGGQFEVAVTLHVTGGATWPAAR